MHRTQLFGEVSERRGVGCKYQDVWRPTAEEWGVGWGSDGGSDGRAQLHL